MIRDEFTLKNGCVVRIDDSMAALMGTPEGDRIAREQRDLVTRMMHKRFRENAKGREDMEYGDTDGGF